MYLNYTIKRILLGILSYILIISMYSVVLNTKVEATVWVDVMKTVKIMMQTEQIRNLPYDEYMAVKEEYTQIAAALYEVDKPFTERILQRIGDALTFNFGNIRKDERGKKPNPLRIQLISSFRNTMKLFTFSTIFSFWLGVVIGKRKAMYRNSLFDKTTSIMTFIFYGTPTWWLANIFIYLFVFLMPIMPYAQFHTRPFIQNPILFFLDSMYFLSLPILTLIISGVWGTAYIVKNILLSNLGEDYIMSARARGIPERKVVHSHALRTAAPPIVTMGLTALATSFAGNIIMEIIFVYPGLGLMLWDSINTNYIHGMMAVLCCITMIYCILLIILDLVYGYLDPRINFNPKR